MRSRVGVVGAGVAAARHLPRLLRRDDITVVGIAEPAPDRRRAAAAEYGIATFDSAAALFASEKLDAVFICVPPHAHGELEDLAAETETAMFIEKPIARDLATAERIARRIGGRVPVAVGYQWRQLSFLPALIGELERCDPNLVIATWMCPTATAPWWGDVDLAGGQIVEQATHVVDLSIVLAGPISTVLSGAGSEARLDNGATGFHKASVATARFANGAVGSFVAACELAQPHRRSVEVLADGVTVVVNDAAAVLIDAHGQRTWDHEGADLYEREQTGFFELLAHGRTDLPVVDYEQALVGHRAACAMEASLAQAVEPGRA